MHIFCTGADFITAADKAGIVQAVGFLEILVGIVVTQVCGVLPRQSLTYALIDAADTLVHTFAVMLIDVCMVRIHADEPVGNGVDHHMCICR